MCDKNRIRFAEVELLTCVSQKIELCSCMKVVLRSLTGIMCGLYERMSVGLVERSYFAIDKSEITWE